MRSQLLGQGGARDGRRGGNTGGRRPSRGARRAPTWPCTSTRMRLGPGTWRAREALGRRAATFGADLTKSGDVTRTVADVQSHFGA